MLQIYLLNFSLDSNFGDLSITSVFFLSNSDFVNKMHRAIPGLPAFLSVLKATWLSGFRSDNS